MYRTENRSRYQNAKPAPYFRGLKQKTVLNYPPEKKFFAKCRNQCYYQNIQKQILGFSVS